jgi:putative phage-type endonuclease
MIKIHDVEQKSPEWFKLREQYPLTASEAQAIGNQGAGLETLCWTKVSEKYSSSDKEQYINKDLLRGNELEDQARELYELQTNTKVVKIGFVTDDEISKVGGASPDGDVIDTDGLVEIKAFADLKHFKAIIELKKTKTFKIETQYIWQMQQQMLFTGKKWVDFVPYNPNYSQSLLIQRVYVVEDLQNKIREGLKKGEVIINEIEANFL